MDLSRFYQQFREETGENLRIFTDGMLVLERAASSDEAGAREHLDAIFRAMHTIKGSSRLLGFGAIGRLAHTMENILGAVRDGTHRLERPLIDAMLKSGDALLEMTTAAVDGGTTDVDVDARIEREPPFPGRNGIAHQVRDVVVGKFVNGHSNQSGDQNGSRDEDHLLWA